MIFRRVVAAAGFSALLAPAGCGLLAGRETPSPAVLQARAADDARIAAEVERRLAAEPAIGPGRVRVVVERGEVQLHGSVAGLGALRCAETNAELTRGVTLVIDFLVLLPGSPEANCLSPRQPV